MINAIVLGSGTSMGVPMAGCDCRVCRSGDPRDKRLRPSVLLEINGFRLLIDTSADYRQQMLREGISDLDAVLYTHHHVDHILGLDDLRSFSMLNKKSYPLFGMRETLQNIRRVFQYVFPEDPQAKVYPRVTLREIDENPFEVGALQVVPIPLLHGQMPVMGYRIGNFAYCTDVSFIPERAFQRLEGLEVLILDALRYKPHPTHFTVAEAVEAARRIGARQTYFTHISHGILHREAELPPGMALAYDGLTFSVEF
ncbi:MAG: MBL fold metallo-hydrolase [Calditrichaeota bacterium]|nr:MBL fold metallo-hydrolase [Calditrichota bacterium]HQU70874.1 MBL fold metallo-hydrolase [Calditrichia bacterium]